MAPRITRRQKANAVVLGDALNSSDAAGAQLGISGRNIRRWRNDPDLAEIVRKTREESAEGVKVAMVLAWDRIIERLQADEIETRDLIVLGGIAFDKHQLATGGATGRTESRDITGTLSDAELVAAILEAEEITTRGGRPDQDPGAPEG